MRIATFLPHVGVFGGVRRMIELGNAWTALGHDVMLYHPEGEQPQWLPFAGRVAALEESAGAGSDLAVGADPHTYGAFRAHRAGVHLYYCVIEGDAGVARAAEDRTVRLAANSSPLRARLRRRLRREVLDGIGGINLNQFRPDPARRARDRVRVLLNGRRSRRKKGTDLILHALAGLERGRPGLEIVLFDHVDAHNRQDPRPGASLPEHARYVLNPSQEELVALYQGCDLFVAAERKAGWCNTALEAMACGAAVVCTPSGTCDFARHGENAWVVRLRHPWLLRGGIRRLLDDRVLRTALGRAGPSSVRTWAWDGLARKLLDQLGASGQLASGVPRAGGEGATRASHPEATSRTGVQEVTQ